jgi:hypothetical protein
MNGFALHLLESYQLNLMQKNKNFFAVPAMAVLERVSGEKIYLLVVTITLGILGTLAHFRHFSGLSGLGYVKNPIILKEKELPSRRASEYDITSFDIAQL